MSTSILISAFVALFFIISLSVYSHFRKKLRLKEASSESLKGKDADAEKKLMEIINENPEEKEAYEKLFLLYFKAEKYEEALTILEKALANSTIAKLWGQENILLLGGICAKNLKKYQKAQKYFLTVMGLNAENPDGLKNLAIVEYYLDENIKADSYFQKCYSMKDKIKFDKEFVKTFAFNSAKLGRNNDTVKILEPYMVKYPKDTDAAYYLGMGYYENKDYLKAQEFLKIGIYSKEYRESAMYTLAHIYVSQDDDKTAKYLLEKVIQSKNTKGVMLLEAYYLLGDLLSRNNKIEEAVIYWNKISSIKKDFKDVEAKLNKYSSLTSDELIRNFSLSAKNEYTAYTKKLTASLMAGSRIQKIDFLDEETIDILVIKQVKSKNVNVLFRFIKDTNTVGELVVKDLYLKGKENKCIKTVLVTVGSLSLTAKDYIATRPMDHIDRGGLSKKLSQIIKKPPQVNSSEI